MFFEDREPLDLQILSSVGIHTPGWLGAVPEVCTNLRYLLYQFLRACRENDVVS